MDRRGGIGRRRSDQPTVGEISIGNRGISRMLQECKCQNESINESSNGGGWGGNRLSTYRTTSCSTRTRSDSEKSREEASEGGEQNSLRRTAPHRAAYHISRDARPPWRPGGRGFEHYSAISLLRSDENNWMCRRNLFSPPNVNFSVFPSARRLGMFICPQFEP